MYKAAVRWMIRRNIASLNAGDYRPALAMFSDDLEFSFPGDNSWADEFRPLRARPPGPRDPPRQGRDGAVPAALRRRRDPDGGRGHPRQRAAVEPAGRRPRPRLVARRRRATATTTGPSCSSPRGGASCARRRTTRTPSGRRRSTPCSTTVLRSPNDSRALVNSVRARSSSRQTIWAPASADTSTEGEAMIAANGHTNFELHARVENLHAIAFALDERAGWTVTIVSSTPSSTASATTSTSSAGERQRTEHSTTDRRPFAERLENVGARGAGCAYPAGLRSPRPSSWAASPTKPIPRGLRRPHSAGVDGASCDLRMASCLRSASASWRGGAQLGVLRRRGPRATERQHRMTHRRWRVADRTADLYLPHGTSSVEERGPVLPR